MTKTFAAVGKITSVAAETGADLVVVGHHRQGVWTRWLNRSVAAELSDALGCSLRDKQVLMLDLIDQHLH